MSALGQKLTSLHPAALVCLVPFADMARGRISSAGRVLSRVGTRPSRSPVAMDEMLELFDNELLITDNAFHHVANRNYTN
jgi:hypothetical protein